MQFKNKIDLVKIGSNVGNHSAKRVSVMFANIYPTIHDNFNPIRLAIFRFKFKIKISSRHLVGCGSSV